MGHAHQLAFALDMFPDGSLVSTRSSIGGKMHTGCMDQSLSQERKRFLTGARKNDNSNSSLAAYFGAEQRRRRIAASQHQGFLRPWPDAVVSSAVSKEAIVLDDAAGRRFHRIEPLATGHGGLPKPARVRARRPSPLGRIVGLG